jgi:CheY-like chemotaxis protein
MTLVDDPLDRVRVRLHLLADHAEGRLDVVLLQQVEHRRGVVRGAVVERQREPFALAGGVHHRVALFVVYALTTVAGQSGVAIGQPQLWVSFSATPVSLAVSRCFGQVARTAYESCLVTSRHHPPYISPGGVRGSYEPLCLLNCNKGGIPVRSLQILVVDDDDADALMISEALGSSERDTTVRRVVDGQEALDYLRREGKFPDAHRPDLILLDLNMPRMDGRETLAAIKTDDSLKAIPVVILTTSGATPDIRASYQGRANAYVTKPFGLDDFEDTVRQIDRFYREVAVLPGASA